MPLKDLKVETNIDGQLIQDEQWHRYTQNQQMKRETAPDHSQAKTMPVLGPKPVRPTPTKQDQALTKANKKDLTNRNLK